MSVIPNSRVNYGKAKNARRSVSLLPGIQINNLNNINKIQINNNLSDRKKKRKRKSVIIKDKYHKKASDREIEIILNHILNLYKNPYEQCINSLIQFPSFRNKAVLDLIKPYLRELFGLMNIISKEKNEELSEKTLNQIALDLQYKKIGKNKFICKYGEKGNHFYIILKGKVVFLVPKMIKCYLNESEYFTYLLKLKKNGENELLRIVMNINRQYFDLGDDFDVFIRELIVDFKNKDKKKSPYINNQIYRILEKMVQEEDNNKKRISNENNDIKNEEIINAEYYMERIKVNDINLNSKDRKKVSLYMYEITNNYEDGQIFGMVALENKSGKRTATAISLEDCELGLLSKEQYLTNLYSIHQKSLEMLFNLINSYSILGLAPKRAFDNRFCHMFKCVRFKRGENLLEENKKINSVIIFNGGQFKITLNKNILELKELMIKLYKIRGKMMGLSENIIKKELNKKYGKDPDVDKKFILPETMKMYKKKHNLTLSIINDKLVIGLFDTVDQDTHLPLFNCTCISKFCDGFEITNNSLMLVNKEYSCLNNNNQIFLINIEYYLKRLDLHMKEIELKIEDFNKNLKYDIKKIKRIPNINIINNNETEENICSNENDKNGEENLFDIRRNTFEKKKKNNNEISLFQIIGNPLKNEYSAIKKQRFNIVENIPNTESSVNLNIENKRYENIKTMNEEVTNDFKEKDLSFIHKVKKSIKEKQHLLRLAQGRSQKFLERKKAEIRSINMARNIKIQKDKYIDISAIFNGINNSKDQNNFGRKSIKSAKRKDLLLDNILYKINKKAKYERVLSSYISRNKSINKEEEDEENEEENNNKEKEDNIKDKNKEKKLIRKMQSKKDFSINYKSEEKTPIININKSLQINRNEKIIKLPIIEPNLRNKLKEKANKDEFNNLIGSRKIITLEGINTLGERSLVNSKSSRKKFKRYNKIIKNNNIKSQNLKLLNKININSNPFCKDNQNLKIITINNKLPNIISIYNKEKVHFFDPLVFDKFNDHYNNNRLNTLDK